jgi:hypothetical protein
LALASQHDWNVIITLLLLIVMWDVGVKQRPSAPLANLSAPAAISATTSVHAVEHAVSPLGDLRAHAPGAAKPQCALEGGREPMKTHLDCMGSIKGTQQHQGSFSGQHSPPDPSLQQHLPPDAVARNMDHGNSYSSNIITGPAQDKTS